MRIFPIALIVIGSLGVAKHFGLIPVGSFHLIGPLLLLVLGVSLLLRQPQSCQRGWRGRRGRGQELTAPAPTPSEGT